MSGVVPTDACKVEFLKLKDKRAYKFVTYKIDAKKGVVDVCECVEKTASFDFQTLIDKLPADEPRYFVLDWSATTEDDRHIDKIFFVSWVPDTCKAKTKMLYASSKQALRNALDGVQLDHQATDYDEVTPEEFNERSGV